jgi:hypothetical protein
MRHLNAVLKCPDQGDLMKRLLPAILIVLIVLTLASAFDQPDNSKGMPKIGDQVVFYTDHDFDGLYEKSPGIVVDDPSAYARLTNEGIVQPGHVVNLYVVPSQEAMRAAGEDLIPFYSFGAHRGRHIGGYESLSASNH